MMPLYINLIAPALRSIFSRSDQKPASETPCNTIGTSRDEMLGSLLQVSSEDAAVREELEGRLERLRAQGVVSISGGVHNNQPESSTPGKLWTLNNIIRQYEEGKGDVKTIGPKL